MQVFEGTGSGQVKMRSVCWFGRVFGMKEGKYMVRNRILAEKGSPALIQGEYLTLQFGLRISSEERAHTIELCRRGPERELKKVCGSAQWIRGGGSAERN